MTAKELWRVGKNVPINVYEGDRPVCQCHTAEDAERIVQAMNMDPDPDLPPIPAEEYQGMKAGEALGAYLRRQDRRGHKIHIYRVVQDLTKAGAYLGKQRPGRTLFESQVQLLRIKLKNSRELVDWEPKGDKEKAMWLWLAESASKPPKMRKR